MQITPSVHNINNKRNEFAQNLPNFTSKSSIIRELSDISMRTRREFPLASNTIIERYSSYNNPVAWKAYRYTEKLVGEVRGFASQSPTRNMKLIKLLDSSKELGVGNCSEYAEATCLACKLNGYKDARVYSLYAYNPETKKFRNLDHALVGINFGKPAEIDAGIVNNVYMRDNNAIIVDTWAGITDYERNMSTNYRKDKIFGKNLSPQEVLCYIESGDSSSLSRDDILFLRHQYPSLSLSQKSSVKDRLRWWVMDKEKYEYDPVGALHLKEIYRSNCQMKGALSKDELTIRLTQEAHVNAEKRIVCAKQKEQEKQQSSYIIRKKLQKIGQKIFK